MDISSAPLTPEQRQQLRTVRGFIYSRETFGTVDGPGIRYVVFMQGCVYRCQYCHNPDSIPTGRGEAWTAGALVDEIMRYQGYIRKGGVTFSGGEPLLQAEFVRACIILLQEKAVHTAIDTAGLLLTGGVRAAVDAADLLLLDIKAIDEKMALRLTGRSNQDALMLLEYCEEAHKPVWIRHVLLRGYTLDSTQLENLAGYLEHYQCIKRVELLPFHKLGEPKWSLVDRPYLLSDVEATTREEAEQARQVFRAHGMLVH